ncbi:MAG: tetratricopeptide repeat protein [Candidatus Omnitrophica bacterium]|nr:tetratricopeptide repeat protein [Candidatus Omnitrophota bacterium]
MKNLKLRYYILIFILVSILTFLTGCDTGIYSAEKRYWHASRKFNMLMQNLKNAKSQDYQTVIDAFREIPIRYPSWANSPKAQFNIGQLYAIQNNFPKARAEFEVILKEYPSNIDICATALFSIAAIYEKEEKQEKAIDTLNKLMSNYPNTYSALQAPLYIAQHYKNKAQAQEASVAYAAALKKYQKIIKDNPKTLGAVLAEDLAIACYADQGEWYEAIDYLDSLVRDYPDVPLAPKALFTIGLIYQDQLKQPQNALESYRKLINKYPQNPLVKPAEKQIELINKPK